MQRGRVMPEALPIRDDIAPSELRRLARRESNARVSSRMIALAHALEGLDRGEAARLAGMDRQTLRDWVIRGSTPKGLEVFATGRRAGGGAGSTTASSR